MQVFSESYAVEMYKYITITWYTRTKEAASEYGKATGNILGVGKVSTDEMQSYLSEREPVTASEDIVNLYRGVVDSNGDFVETLTTPKQHIHLYFVQFQVQYRELLLATRQTSSVGVS